MFLLNNHFTLWPALFGLVQEKHMDSELPEVAHEISSKFFKFGSAIIFSNKGDEEIAGWHRCLYNVILGFTKITVKGLYS